MAVAVMSADEYLATPESRPQHTELIHGTVVMNEPAEAHMLAQQELLFALLSWKKAAPGRGQVGLPSDVRLDDANVVAPDLWWAPDEGRWDRTETFLAVPPDLVAEVRSPSTWARDLTVKLGLYEHSGVLEAWYVDTSAHTVLVFRRSTAGSPTFDVTSELAADDVLNSPLLPGFSLRVAEIFER